MFEYAVIRRCGSDGRSIDQGTLAETLLFYDRVRILFDDATIQALLQSLGSDLLIQLMEKKVIKATYLPTGLAVLTNGQDSVPVHKFLGAFSITKPGEKKPNKERLIHRVFERALGESVSTRRAANKFLSHLSFRGSDSYEETILLAERDLKEPQYVKAAVETILTRHVPTFSLPARWYFRAIACEQGFIVDTDLNFVDINREYHRFVSPSVNSITPASLLNQILDARADMCLASDYMAEIITDPVRSSLIRERVGSLIKRRLQSANEIELFQEVRLSNSRAIGQAINSGERTFSEFLELLEKASKFKSWLRDQSPDSNLLSEYLDASFAESLFDKLPSRAVRFSFFTAAALGVEALVPTGIAAAAGIGIGAADAFLLDKLVKGWKPHQFVEGPLKSFVTDR